MALSFEQVAIGTALGSLIAAAAAWGELEGPAPWPHTFVQSIGDAYRQSKIEKPFSVPKAVNDAVVAAWVAVGASVLCAAFLAFVLRDSDPQLLNTAPTGDFIDYYPAQLDAPAAVANGLLLIAVIAAIVAFGRYALGAKVNRALARRSAPLVATGVVLATMIGVAVIHSWPAREFYRTYGFFKYWGNDLVIIIPPVVYAICIVICSVFVARGRRAAA